MTTTDMATEEQIEQIRRRAYSATTRAMERTGFALTYDQADELGAEAISWVRDRLGLRIDRSDTEVLQCISEVTTPECARCGGSHYNLGQCTTCGLASDYDGDE